MNIKISGLFFPRGEKKAHPKSSKAFRIQNGQMFKYII